jgi:hypothetical protein
LISHIGVEEKHVGVYAAHAHSANERNEVDAVPL